MNFLVGVRSARVFGGNTTYSLVGDYLQAGLDEYGEAIAAIEITACFRGGAVGQALNAIARERVVCAITNQGRNSVPERATTL